MKKHASMFGSALLLLCTACTPVLSKAPIRATPQETVDCASGLLGTMGYQLLDRETALRAERAKHASFGGLRADYDRITVAVDDAQLHVRGETVAMSTGIMHRGGATNAGGTTVTWPSSQLRADVKRITVECGGGA
jgi:hypothetical protein